MKNKKRRIIVVGIDGASWDIINTGIPMGLLPTFRYLTKNSVYGILKSILPPISPSAWNAIYTGAFPSKTGIFNFFEFDKITYSYKPISCKNRKIPTIFSLLSLYSYKVFGVNLPFYYPPETVNGCLICGFGSPKVSVYPQEFLEKLKTIIPNFIGDIGDDDIILSRDKDSLKNKTETIFNGAKKLIEYFFKNDFDFGFFVFRAHEPLQHYYFDNLEFILYFYSLIDKTLQYVISQMSEEDVLFIISDHGFRKVKCYVRINNALESVGMFKCNQKRQLPILEQLGKILIKINPKLVRKLLSSPIIWNLLKILPNKSLSYLNSVDWEKTKAFYLEGSEGIIRINLKDREKKGSVSKEEYENVRKEIISKLKSLKSPDNKRVIKDIIPIEKLYGEESKQYGDLVVIPEDDYVASGGYSPNGEIFNYKKGIERPGEHSVDGILIIYSKNKEIVPSNVNLSASVVDIAPTILSIFEIPIPDYMDGEAILELNKEHKKADLEKLKLSLKIRELKKTGKI